MTTQPLQLFHCTCNTESTSDIGHLLKCPLAKPQENCKECDNPQCIAPQPQDPPCGNCHEDHQGKTICGNGKFGEPMDDKPQQNWEEEFDKTFIHAKFCRKSKVEKGGDPCNCDYDGFKNYLVMKLQEERQTIIQELEKTFEDLIVKEINLARSEGEKTSRLNSLFLKLKRK